MRLILFLFLFIFTACSSGMSGQGAKDYLLPWADANGEFHLRTVRISTLNSGNEVSGPAANVYVEPVFTVTGVSGSVAHAQVTVSNGVKIPLDVESAMALAVYANMERIYAFEQSTFGPTGISWPRSVAIEVALVDADSGDLERNNARYYGDQDVVAVFPHVGNGLPMAVNTAILAHEHFHSHFHASVIRAVKSVPGSQHKDVAKMDFSIAMDYNTMVIRAWNEGVADFYSAVYTGAPNMIAASLGTGRRVDGKFSRLLSRDEFRDQLARGQRTNREAREDWCESLACAYGQGTQLARWLYQFAGKDGKAILSQVIANLPELAELSRGALDQRFMELSEAVGILMQGVPLTQIRCERLHRLLSTRVMNERFSACATL